MREVSWEMIVAQAAPATPMPNPKMNRGSMATLRRPPTTVLTMAGRAAPPACTIVEAAMLTALNAAPRRMMRVYGAAYTRRVSVAPKTHSNGSVNARPTAA